MKGLAKTGAAEPEDPAPSEPAAESQPTHSALVLEVMGLTQMRTVEATEAGIQVTFPFGRVAESRREIPAASG